LKLRLITGVFFVFKKTPVCLLTLWFPEFFLFLNEIIRSKTFGILKIHIPAFLPNLFIFLKEKNKKDFPSSQG